MEQQKHDMKRHVLNFDRFSVNESMGSKRPITVMTIGAGDSLAGFFNSYEQAKEHITRPFLSKRNLKAKDLFGVPARVVPKTRLEETFQEYVDAIEEDHEWHVKNGSRKVQLTQEEIVERAWEAFLSDSSVYFDESNAEDIVRGLDTLDTPKGVRASWDPPANRQELDELMAGSSLDPESEKELYDALEQRGPFEEGDYDEDEDEDEDY